MKYKIVLTVRSKSEAVKFECLDFYEMFGTLSFVLENIPFKVARVPLSEVLWLTQTEIEE